MKLVLNNKRINSIKILEKFNIEKIKIGIPVKNDEARKVCLTNVGDVVLPDAKFGPLSKKNANGYSYADKTKQKEMRYVNTIRFHPYGNDNADEIYKDIYRLCYPKIEVPPYEISLQLTSNSRSELFIYAVLTKQIRDNFIKEAINLLLEIFGICVITDEDIDVNFTNKTNWCNWVILPPGEKPSDYLKNFYNNNSSKKNMDFDLERLKYIESFNYISDSVGINGFRGYTAFIFEKYCVFECATYGNAIYIVERENWEELSKRTKKELIVEGKVVAKIEHKEFWKESLKKEFKKLGITRRVEV